jgi:hypothetical protein
MLTKTNSDKLKKDRSHWFLLGAGMLIGLVLLYGTYLAHGS